MNRLRNKIGINILEFNLLAIHAAFGLAILIVPFLSKIYTTAIIALAFLVVLKTKNQKNEVLIVCGYLVGADVFMRMSHGFIFTEQIKYAVIVLMLLGMAYKSSSFSSIYYVFYLLLLVPGIYYASFNIIEYGTDFRKDLAFNLSGPVCTGVCGLYCINRKITYNQIRQVLLFTLLPIMAMLSYIVFFRPNVHETITTTGSNFLATGMYGPNQVSVVLGLGAFIACVRFFMFSGNWFWKVFNASLFVFLSYRALITFSRGGVITAFAAIVLFIAFGTFMAKPEFKRRVLRSLAGLALLTTVAWGYSNIVSDGLLFKRYNNQDAAGREKKDALGGREQLMSHELLAFTQNPFFGVGVGNNKYYREEISDIQAATHSEVTRLMAEHGIFGIAAFLILFLTPLIRFLTRHRNIFALSFFLIWFLTINHNATRIALPAFVYGLSLLTISFEKNTLHRQQTSAVGQ